jgi:DNA-binding PadR family transcriptional regulator
MLLNISDTPNERSVYMKSPFGRDFPFGTVRAPGLTVNFGQHGFGRTKQRKRFRNGDVRAAVLVLLAEQPMHGYQIIQEIAQRTGALWQPSPGSVYPVLQQLEDEGLVLVEHDEGRKVANLTEAGRAYVEENRAELEEVWNALTNNDEVDESTREMRNLFVALQQIGVAAKQVAKVGTDEQLADARKLLAETRRRLYLILAEDGTGEE